MLCTAIFSSGAAFGSSPTKVSPPPAIESFSDPSELRSLILSGHLSGLRWPDFPELRHSLESFYAQADYRPAWLSDGGLNSQAKEIISLLQNADEKGLNPDDYDAARLLEWAGQLGAAANTGSAARLDLAISLETMRYISALHYGRVDPHQAHFGLNKKDAQLDLATFLREHILNSQGVRQEMDGIEPPFVGYRQTEAALIDYLAKQKNDVAKMPSRPRGNLQPGEAYADLSALAARLALLGDLAAPLDVQGNVYQGSIVEAMKRFQSRHGLTPSGVLDAATYRALTTPLSKRVLQLQLTLERWRWLPTDILPAIVVNIPEFELRAFDEHHQVTVKMHVIVGKAYRHRTPVFEDKLESIIIRPYWNVPESIQRAEILPNLRRDPGYLQKHNFQLVNAANQPQATPSREELLARLASGALRVRQLPGPANSLGLLKFNFPNSYSVYLHGTPQQSLFSRSRRDFSHGCIRIEDPVALATWVLQGQGNWSREQIVDAINSQETLTIPVHRPITVLLLYATAVVEKAGQVQFFEDLYGYDSDLQTQLAHGYPYTR